MLAFPQLATDTRAYRSCVASLHGHTNATSPSIVPKKNRFRRLIRLLKSDLMYKYGRPVSKYRASFPEAALVHTLYGVGYFATPVRYCAIGLSCVDDATRATISRKDPQYRHLHITAMTLTPARNIKIHWINVLESSSPHLMPTLTITDWPIPCN